MIFYGLFMEREMFGTERHVYRNLLLDVLFMMTGMILAFALCVGIFEWMRGAGLIDAREAGERTVALKPAAEEPVTLTKKNTDSKVDDETAKAGAGAIVLADAKQYLFAYAGDEDAILMSFLIKPKENVKLKRLTISLDGYATPADLENLQLYLAGKFIGEVPFYEAKGAFRDLNLELGGGEESKFEIRGKISNGAISGDRIKIGITGGDDILLQNTDSKKIDVYAQWPLWGGYVSVVGAKIKKPVSEV